MTSLSRRLLRPPFAPSLLAASCLLVSTLAQATSFSVSNESQLQQAILAANASIGPHFIEFSSDITLTGPLPPILNDLTIKGNNHLLDGDGQTRLLFIGSSGEVDAPRILVKLSDLGLVNGSAAGGDGASGGGGGLGAGGAVFVNSQADVVLNNVALQNNAAAGGDGASGNGGGGGGLGGAGGDGIGGGGGGVQGAGGDALAGGAGGGGGLQGAGANGSGGAGGGGGYTGAGGESGMAGANGNALYWQSGSGGSGTGGAAGGSDGGGGGGDAFNAGGGGFGGANGSVGGDGGFGGGGGAVVGAGSAGDGGFGGGGGGNLGTGTGGKGGFGGGGGGAPIGAGGNGGFGGGGGSSITGTGGNGGFGGGGGAGQTAGGNGGLGGGAASTNQGGGGAGLGGAIFVAQGGSISVDGDIEMSGGSVSAGSGANNGAAAGNGLFLQGSGTLTLKVNDAKTVTIADGIADSVGAGIATSSFQRWNLNISGGGPVPVDSDDPSQGSTYGKVILSGNNQYAGNTYVAGADLVIGDMRNLGTGNGVVALDDGGLILAGTMDMTRDITVASGGGRIGALGNATLSGDVTGAGTMVKVGAGDLNLTGDTLLTSGNWLLREGKLHVGSDARLGAANIGLIMDGGGLVYENVFTLRDVTLTARGGTLVNAAGAGNDIHVTEGIAGAGAITFQSNSGQTFFIDNQLTNIGGTVVSSGQVQGAIGQGDLSVSSGATYLLGGGDRQVGMLSGTGQIVLGSNDLTASFLGLSDDPKATQFDGVISGSGGLVMLGNEYATLALSGSNTYTGGTRVIGGKLAIANDSNVNGGNSTVGYDVQLEDDAILRFGLSGFTSNLNINLVNSGGIESTGDLTLAGNISGSNVELKKIGLGTLTLDHANTYSGTTVVEGTGSLIALANAQGLGDSRLVLSGGGGLKLLTSTSSLQELELAGGDGIIDTNGFDAAVTQALSGAGNLVKQGGGTMTLLADSLFTGNTSILDGVLQLGNGGMTGDLNSGTVNISAGAALVVNRDGNLTLGGDISGSGRVEMSGPGTLTLSPGSANTFLGGLLVSNGLVAAASEKALGFGNVTLNGGGLLLLGNIVHDIGLGAAGGTLAVGGSDNFLLKGDLTGPGDFTKAGTGTLVYTGVAGHAGGTTTVAEGTLRIGSGLSGALVGDVDVDTGATLVFGRDDLTLYQGVIDGDGTVVKLGAGELVLTGEQLFDGIFDVQAGNLRIGYGGTVGSLSGDVALASGTRLVFDRSDNSTFSGDTTGNGAVTKNGAGTLTLTGDLAHSGGTLLNSGRLVVGDYNAADATNTTGLSGSLTGNVSMGASTELVFNRRDDVTIAGNISGAGKLVQSGSGTTTLTGNNTQTGGVTVENGHLAIDSDACLGNSSGKLILRNGGVLTYLANFSLRDITLEPSGGGLDSNGMDIAYTGLINGSGNFIKEGLGRLTVTRMLLEGDLQVRDGELRIGDGTDSSDSVATLGNADIARFTDGGGTLHVANLTLNRRGLVNFEGALSGGGDLRQLGGGELRLPGDSSGFTGSTYIDNGSLRLNGSLGGDLNLASGTSLQGNGTLLGNLVSNGATIKPGNSIGTLTVGSLTLDAASTLEMEMDATGASDRINVTGAAALAGTLHLLPQPGDYTTAGCCTYTLINAGSVSGTFATVTNDLVFLNTTVDYQPTAVNVSFNRNAAAFTTVSLTYNQQQVSSALDVVEAQDPSNPLVQLITPLTAEQARDAYDVLSGDSLLNTVNASARSARRFNHLLSARSSRLGLASRGGSTESMEKSLSSVRSGQMPEAPLAFTQSLDPMHYDGPTSKVEGLWVEANAFKTSEDSDDVVGSAASSFNGSLVALGVDGYWGNNLILGFGAGYLQGSMSYDNRQGDGDATGSFVGSYGRWETDSGWHYKAALTLGQQSTDQTRSGSIGATTAKAVSTVDVQTATAEFEAGLALHVGNYGLRPYVLIDTQYLKRDAITESGAGAADLQVEAANNVAGEFGVGAEISRPWLTDGARWAQLQAGLALLQPFGDTQREQTVRFSGMSNSYTVKATPDDSAALQLTVGGEWYFSRSLALWGGYEGRISSSTQEHNGVISIQYRW